MYVWCKHDISAGILWNIRSNTAYIYGPGRPYVCEDASTGSFKVLMCGLSNVCSDTKESFEVLYMNFVKYPT
jgi:hypothetical protein